MNKFISRKVMFFSELSLLLVLLIFDLAFILPFNISENNYAIFGVVTSLCLIMLIFLIITYFDKIIVSTECITHITLAGKKTIKREEISKIVVMGAKYVLILVIPTTVDLDILNYNIRNNDKKLKFKDKNIIHFDSSKRNISILEKYGYKIDGQIDLRQ